MLVEIRWWIMDMYILYSSSFPLLLCIALQPKYPFSRLHHLDHQISGMLNSSVKHFWQVWQDRYLVACAKLGDVSILACSQAELTCVQESQWGEITTLRTHIVKQYPISVGFTYKIRTHISKSLRIGSNCVLIEGHEVPFSNVTLSTGGQGGEAR